MSESKGCGCGGCLGFILVLAAIGAVIQGVTFLWVNYWQAIVAISVSTLSLAYVRVISREKDDA